MSTDSLPWDDRFVRTLPGDPDRTTTTRQVLQAAYAHTTPTPVAAPSFVPRVATCPRRYTTRAATSRMLAASGTR